MCSQHPGCTNKSMAFNATVRDVNGEHDAKCGARIGQTMIGYFWLGLVASLL